MSRAASCCDGCGGCRRKVDVGLDAHQRNDEGLDQARVRAANVLGCGQRSFELGHGVDIAFADDTEVARAHYQQQSRVGEPVDHGVAKSDSARHRILIEHNNGQPLTYLGSADWRNRNLNSRVELITPITEPALQQRLVQILEDALNDNRLAWDLKEDGRYVLRYPAENEKVRHFHKILMKQARKRSKKPKLA